MDSSTGSGIAIVLIGLVALAALIALYFLPLIVAQARGHRQTTAIFILNLLLGWTLLGWVAALVWACTNPAPVTRPQPVVLEREPFRSPALSHAQQVEEIGRFASMRDDGTITEEEFTAKKRMILGLS